MTVEVRLTKNCWLRRPQPYHLVWFAPSRSKRCLNPAMAAIPY